MQHARQAAHARDGVVEKGMVRVTNRAGKSPLLLVCDHASNYLPPISAHSASRKATCCDTSLGTRERCRWR